MFGVKKILIVSTIIFPLFVPSILNAEEEGVGDYGKSSIENKPNERDMTQSREHRNNVTMAVKKIIKRIKVMIPKKLM